jgi:hypothetical protein
LGRGALQSGGKRNESDIYTRAVPISVTVALVGDPTRSVDELGYTFGDLDQPWGQLPKMDVEAHEDETLASVLDRAAVRFELAETEWGQIYGFPSFVAFYKPDDEKGGIGPLSHTVTLVDQAGRARWNVPFAAARVGELIRAAEAGALTGDPRRVYFVLQPPAGNGLVADWPTLVNLLDYAWRVILGVGGAYEATKATKAVIERLTKRTKDAAQVAAARGEEWAARGGDPGTLRVFLTQAARTADDVAHLLGCTTEEAEAILWAFGFSKDERGVWLPEQDEESKLMSGNIEVLLYASGVAPVGPIIEIRTEVFVETGEAPQVDWTFGIAPEELGEE